MTFKSAVAISILASALFISVLLNAFAYEENQKLKHKTEYPTMPLYKVKWKHFNSTTLQEMSIPTSDVRVSAATYDFTYGVGRLNELDDVGYVDKNNGGHPMMLITINDTTKYKFDTDHFQRSNPGYSIFNPSVNQFLLTRNDTISNYGCNMIGPPCTPMEYWLNLPWK